MAKPRHPVFMKFSKFTIAALLLLLSSMIYAQPPYQWVQMVANNQLSVRAILLKDGLKTDVYFTLFN
jgi:hypothetical protein